MPFNMTVKFHSVDQDGYPSYELTTTGRVAFIWDGYIVSGWPIHHIVRRDGTTYPEGTWQPADDRFGGPVAGVTDWVEFPMSLWALFTAEADEPTRDAIDRCVVVSGTHRFRVTPLGVPRIRGRLNAAQQRSGQGSMTTRYDAMQRVLTVEVEL